MVKKTQILFKDFPYQRRNKKYEDSDRNENNNCQITLWTKLLKKPWKKVCFTEIIETLSCNWRLWTHEEVFSEIFIYGKECNVNKKHKQKSKEVKYIQNQHETFVLIP